MRAKGWWAWLQVMPRQRPLAPLAVNFIIDSVAAHYPCFHHFEVYCMHDRCNGILASKRPYDMSVWKTQQKTNYDSQSVRYNEHAEVTSEPPTATKV